MSLAVIGTTAVVAGAGASIYGATQAGKGVGGKAPKPVDIFRVAIGGPKKGTTLAGRQATGLLDYYSTTVPGFIALQNQFGPQIAQQMLSQSAQFLEGTSRLSRQAGAAAQQEISGLRASEIASMAGQAGATRSLMQQLSPEQARAVELQGQTAERAQGLEQEFQAEAQPYSGMFGTMAQESFARRGTLSPEEERMAQQRAREASSQAGRVGGNAAISSEILNREAAQAARRQEAVSMGGLAQQQMLQNQQVRAGLRGEAQNATMGLAELAQGFYTRPGFSLLSQTPASYAAGQNSLRTALALGQESAGQFDYNAPLNLAQQQAGAQNASNQANYQVGLANKQAGAQMWGSIGSNLLGAGLSAYGSGAFGGGGGGYLSGLGGFGGTTSVGNTGGSFY